MSNIAAGAAGDRSDAAQDDRTNRVLRWILLVTLVVTTGILVWGTYRTYQFSPPIPSTIASPSGKTFATRADIVQGKASFQRANLMDYGSLFGMGSYFGEDYTAQYLHELTLQTEANIGKALYRKPLKALSTGERATVRAQARQALHHVNLQASHVVVPAAVAGALAAVEHKAVHRLLTNRFQAGWTKAHSLNAASAARVARFILYSALTTVAYRPGKHFSYTNNWPYAPEVGNHPTAATFVWTWISLGWLVLAIGGVLLIYFRFIHTEDEPTEGGLLSRLPELTPSQRKTGKFFLVCALLFLLQILAGSIMAHDYAERANFYGVNLDAWLPFNFLRDVHIQTPIVWIGMAWMGAGLFLAPLIGGHEPKGQGRLVDLLFYATVGVASFGLLGNYAGIQGWLHGASWFWFGNQGLSYLQLGRAFQIALFLGLAFWSVLVGRALWPVLQARRGWTSLEHILFYSTINIVVMYAFGMIPIHWINASFTITDFWRWWVVHLWVEQAFEVFTVGVTAYLLMGLGLVPRRSAERAVLFEVILVLLGGMEGVGHHLYWVGEPGMWLSFGSMFSFIEVLPLVLLVIESLQQHYQIADRKGFPHRLAYLFLLGSAFWNFVGAGVFGSMVNTPLMNYYEHGSFLTLMHAHSAFFGAFGMLAIGLIYFVLRYLNGEDEWNDRLGVWAFWLYNTGMVMWIVLNFWPIGFSQLAAIYEHGYAYGRSLAFYNTTLTWQWLRMPGDIVFAAGALLMSYDFLLKLRPCLPVRLRRFVPAPAGTQPADQPV